MYAIRMLETADASPNHMHVHTYEKGKIYSTESEPPLTPALMEGFVGRGFALEVDAAGNPIGTPAEARAKKAAWEKVRDGAMYGTQSAAAAPGDAENPIVQALMAQVANLAAQVAALTAAQASAPAAAPETDEPPADSPAESETGKGRK